MAGSVIRATRMDNTVTVVSTAASFEKTRIVQKKRTTLLPTVDMAELRVAKPIRCTAMSALALRSTSVGRLSKMTSKAASRSLASCLDPLSSLRCAPVDCRQMRTAPAISCSWTPSRQCDRSVSISLAAGSDSERAPAAAGLSVASCGGSLGVRMAGTPSSASGSCGGSAGGGRGGGGKSRAPGASPTCDSAKCSWMIVHVIRSSSLYVSSAKL
mmetsp:Transcript_68259/g.127399  ORF Transcript_68259/g.127399 Transcript_68259/m.127399 type:complete len:214 (-) Transcript_68259:539-1180(-)